MKKLITLLLIGILISGCSKPEPEPRTYDLTGRVYARYTIYSFSPNRRHYHIMEFASDTSVYRYNGTDTLGVDSLWHRKDTVIYSLDGQLQPYLYKIIDVSHSEYIYDNHVAEISLFRRGNPSTIHGDVYETINWYDTYYLKSDENWIWNRDQITDEYQRVR